MKNYLKNNKTKIISEVYFISVGNEINYKFGHKKNKIFRFKN